MATNTTHPGRPGRKERVKPGAKRPDEKNIEATTRKRPSTGKRKAEKPTPRKKRTLILPDLPSETVTAIDRGKDEFGIGHTTRTALKMLNQYWDKSDRLDAALIRIRQLEQTLERAARAHCTIDNAEKELQEILIKYYDEY